jgi:prevent-host-death family protein
MKTMAIGELKAHFSEVLEEVAQGRPVAIGRGRKKDKVAVILSYSQYRDSAEPRRLGVLEGRARYVTSRDFKISDEEFVS